MSWQFITMGMGMGSVFGGKRWFFNRFMRRMGKGMFSRMVPGIFKVTGPVFAGPGFKRGILSGILFWCCMSR
jgi:hypothetical protein